MIFFFLILLNKILHYSHIHFKDLLQYKFLGPTPIGIGHHFGISEVSRDAISILRSTKIGRLGSLQPRTRVEDLDTPVKSGD